VEIIGTNNVIAGVGLPSRVSQNSPRPPMPQSARTANAPGQGGSSTDEARAAGRSQETNPGAGGAASLEQAVRESVEKLNNFIRPYVTSLRFSVDKDLGHVVVKVMDNETKEVLKQIPSEDALALTKALGKVAGLIVRQEA